MLCWLYLLITAYSLEELEHKANALREKAKGSGGGDDESSLQVSELFKELD